MRGNDKFCYPLVKSMLTAMSEPKAFGLRLLYQKSKCGQAVGLRSRPLKSVKQKQPSLQLSLFRSSQNRNQATTTSTPKSNSCRFVQPQNYHSQEPALGITLTKQPQAPAVGLPKAFRRKLRYCSQTLLQLARGVYKQPDWWGQKQPMF